MSNIPNASSKKIEEALENVRKLIQDAVREEQMVDQLTGLANDKALDAWLQDKLVKNEACWLAFVEVDRFKIVNHKFGYILANELLKRVAGQLKNAALNYSVSQIIPFRAHGDEFFLAGAGGSTNIQKLLETVRTNIDALSVASPQHNEPMQCTVSIGWAETQTCRADDNELLTVQSFRGFVEVAVNDAKRDRNCVRKYDPSMKKAPVRSGRTDCKQCRSLFVVDVPVTDQISDDLYCPNCGTRASRPATLAT